MANEVVFNGTTGKANYFIIIGRAATNAGKVWNGSTWETITASHWATYWNPSVEATGTGIFVGSLPANFVAGDYVIEPYQQATGPYYNGASAADTDTKGTSYILPWNGVAIAQAGQAYIPVPASPIKSALGSLVHGIGAGGVENVSNSLGQSVGTISAFDNVYRGS